MNSIPACVTTMRAVHDANPPITREELRSFARRYDLQLPKAYEEFLLRNNGGRPEPEMFPIEGLENNPFGGIQTFFGLKASIATEDLEKILTEECRNIPPDILPVACTDGGDFVCLDLRKAGAPVVFWDRVPFWGNEIWKEDYLYPVAANFEALLTSLRDCDSTLL